MNHDVSFRTAAYGAGFAVSTPFHLSTFFSLQSFLLTKDVDNATLAGLLSLTTNLPYLCGLGGDCLILRSDSFSNLSCYNGTGRTGSGHSIDFLHARGKTHVDRRGWGSAMVYGAPYALKSYSHDYDVDVRTVINLLKLDIGKGIPASSTLTYFIKQHLADLEGDTLPAKWRNALRIGADAKACTMPTASPAVDLFRALADEGFGSMYHGIIADQCCAAMIAHSGGYFIETDIANFSPPDAATFTMSFFDAKVEMVAFNTPWLELCALLTILERFSKGSPKPFDEGLALYICRAAGMIDKVIASRRTRRALSMDPAQQRVLLDSVVADVLTNFDITEDHSVSSSTGDTIFMAVAAVDGTIVGLTSSIFTPFGAMIDPGEIGVLLSNRAFSFDLDPTSWNSLQPREPASHTTNVLIITTACLRFALGATGGSVQPQVLTQILYRIVALRQQPQTALEAPRFANMGYSAKHGRNVMLAERRMAFDKPSFEIEPDLSPKFGVAQIAGVDMIRNLCFGATDPRGEGAALAV